MYGFTGFNETERKVKLMAEKPNDWTIIAATDSGDTASIAAHPEETLRVLRAKAVHELYGQQANPEEYEILIDGVKAEDLELGLAQAGLHDGSEIVVQIDKVHRG